MIPPSSSSVTFPTMSMFVAPQYMISDFIPYPFNLNRAFQVAIPSETAIIDTNSHTSPQQRSIFVMIWLFVMVVPDHRTPRETKSLALTLPRNPVPSHGIGCLFSAKSFMAVRVRSTCCSRNSDARSGQSGKRLPTARQQENERTERGSKTDRVVILLRIIE